jgi:TonB family protein
VESRSINAARLILIGLLAAALGCVSGSPSPRPGSVARVADALAYRQVVEGTIASVWERPEAPRGRFAIVVFSIRADGAIAHVQLLESSGDARFDASAVAAVERSPRLPPPPPHAREEMARFEMYFSTD